MSYLDPKWFVANEPWPHIRFNRFFNDGVIDLMLRYWPTEGWRELWYPDQQKPDGHYRRKQLALEDIDGNDFWEQLYLELISETLWWDMAAGVNVPDTNPRAFPFPLLIDDEPGYWIRRHPDTTSKVITSIIWLDGHQNDGTHLLGNNGDRVPMPIVPNKGFAFYVTGRGTDHEVPQPGSKERRRSLQLTYYRTEKDARSIRYAT